MTNYGIVYLHEYEDYALFFMTQFFNTIQNKNDYIAIKMTKKYTVCGLCFALRVSK